MLVLGRLCSGKGYVASQLKNRAHETTSFFVKKVSGETTRQNLQGTGDMWPLIVTEIVVWISSNLAQNKKVVIDGIRQVPILLQIMKTFEGAVDIIWLDVPDDVRKNRYLQRGDIKDAQDHFEAADLRDVNLGINTVHDWCRNHEYTLHISND